MLLDVVRVDMVSKAAHPYQPENHIIDARQYWQQVAKTKFADALLALDPIQADLWGTSYGSSQIGSSYSGVNDRVPIANAPAFNYSLRLIRVDDLRMHVSVEGAAFGNPARRLRGFFTYSNNTYAPAVTDPIVEAQYFAGQDGWFDVGDALLCVSLGEPHSGYAYKLIAGVILPP